MTDSPIVLTTDADHAEALKRIRELWDVPKESEEEAEFLTLIDAVFEYEEKRWPIHEEEYHMSDYGFIVGDQIYHIKDTELQGVVTEIDSDFDLGGVTTCRVHWDDMEDGDYDIQWTNKLVRIEP